jgi:hypothetical protein
VAQKKRVTDQIQELEGQTRHMQGLHGVREREGGNGGKEFKGRGLCLYRHVPSSLYYTIAKRQVRHQPAATMIDPHEIWFDVGSNKTPVPALLGISTLLNLWVIQLRQAKGVSSHLRLSESDQQLMEVPRPPTTPPQLSPSAFASDLPLSLPGEQLSTAAS